MDARHNLIEAHLPLVDKIAGGIARRLPRWIRVEDLVSAGRLGLVQAANRYNPARNDSFGAYATPRIRGEIKDELRRSYRLMRHLSYYGIVTEPGYDGESAMLARASAQSIVARLAPRQRFVAEQLWFAERTMKDIGREIGVNESRVSQINAETLAQLRRNCCNIN